MYGITSMKAVQSPKSERVLLGALDEAGRAEDPHPDAGARADHDREDQLALARSPRAPARSAASAAARRAGGKRRSIERSSRGMSSSM